MKKKLTVYLVVMSFLVAAPGLSLARWVPKSKKDKTGLPELQRVLVLDGSNVHNVGELQMHVGNWGEFGSRPGTAETFSESPSAQWPAGSGWEYLFTAGF